MNSRNPKIAPVTAQVTGSNPLLVPIATTVKNTATITVTLPARPSRPSVKFTPLAVPKTTKKRIGIFIHPKSNNNPGIYGTFIARLTLVNLRRYHKKIPVTAICPTNFCIGVSPIDLLHTTFM